MTYTNTIIISAVNLVEGGGLSVLRKCVQEMSQFNAENRNLFLDTYSVRNNSKYYAQLNEIFRGSQN